MNQPTQSRWLERMKDLTALDADVFRRHIQNSPKYSETLTKVEQANFVAEKLGPGDLDSLEAIVMDARPVLLVENDQVIIASESGLWRDRLSAHAEEVSANIKRVGRVEVQGHPYQAYLAAGEEFFVGTCSVIGSGLALTNRHVVLEFCEPDGRIKPGMVPKVDFVEEANRDPDHEIRITRAVEIGTEFDYAIVELEGDGLPRPVNFANSAHDLSAENGETPLVYIVGYPAFDTRNPTEVQYRLFNGKFNVKRLAPGRLRKIVGPPPDGGGKGADQALDCDYSSLGGNSGSPVFDLATGLMVGLHYAGRYAEANYAVPIWSLRDRIKLYTNKTKEERSLTMSDKFIESLLTERVMFMPVGKAKDIAARGINPHSANEVTNAAAALIVLGFFGEEQARQRVAEMLANVHPSLRAAIAQPSAANEMVRPFDDWNPRPTPPWNPRPDPTYPPGGYLCNNMEAVDGRCVAGTVGGAMMGGAGGSSVGPVGATIGAIGGGLYGAATSGCFDRK
jgi:hypothetical protein